jgi:hypothetical protein
LVDAQVTLGTTAAAATGGETLRLWICYQASGGSITTAHPIDYLAPLATQGGLNVYPLTDTITDLAAGAYSFGLCGQLTSSTTAWSLRDWAYTTVEVISGASVVTRPEAEQRPSR